MAIKGYRGLPQIPADRHVLIAGPTASGKSDLALQIAEDQGGVIVNADASQVFDCWRVVTARPSVADEGRARHALYGHVPWDSDYSAGHWLRDIRPLLTGGDRLIIVGGTGLYFTALIQGLADIPETPTAIRQMADTLSLGDLLADIDADTAAGIDTANRMRVQRAWEVQAATGRSLKSWQDDTPAPDLDCGQTVPLLFDVDKAWLNARIERRFDQMVSGGAVEEVAAMLDRYTPNKPAFRAIGVPELAAYLKGETDLTTAREKATISTRQFAKRQRTWFRARMSKWHKIQPET